MIDYMMTETLVPWGWRVAETFYWSRSDRSGSCFTVQILNRKGRKELREEREEALDPIFHQSFLGVVPSRLPNGFQQRAVADVLVTCDQRHTLGSRRRSDQAIHRIFRVVIRKLSGQRCDFWSNRFDLDERASQHVSYAVLNRTV